MAHIEELPQSAVDGLTPDGGARREGLPSVPPMADLEPQQHNSRRSGRGRRNSSPRHSQSPDRQRRRIDPQALEDRVKEQDELIRKMAADMEALKRQMKTKDVATGEGRKHKTPPRHSENRSRNTTPSQGESRSLRTGDTHSLSSRTRHSRSDRARSERSYTKGSTYWPSHSLQTRSRQTELPRSSDLRTVLEEKARCKEDARARDPHRVSALQRLAPWTHGSVEVGMPIPRLTYEPTDKALARLQTSPFVPAIENAPLPSGFLQPKFTTYEGKTDPYSHLSHFRQVMAVYRRNEALMCILFPSSLGDLGLTWFEKLPEGSIASWAQLAEAFVTRFRTNTKTPMEIDQLLSIDMGEKETLRSYNSRYWETFNQIGDCPTNLAIAQYKRGLPVGNRLRDSITMTPPLTMEALMERVHQHIRVEEDGARAKAKSSTIAVPEKKTSAKVNTVDRSNKNGCGKRDSGEDPDKRWLRIRTAITTVFKKPIYRILSEIRDEPFVKWPAKPGEAQKDYDDRSRCTFHKEKGHRTENCTPLRQHLEELVAAGHLDKYIEGGTQPAPQNHNNPNGMPLDAPPQGIINVIHGVFEPERVCELRGSIKKAEHFREVLSAQPSTKKGKTEATNVMSFSDKDLDRIYCPHNDALVVTLRVKDFDVKRILID
ncbi:hypothetical protein HYC85_029985 [Camellia sinensis]|uniref:Retrotransposon gag domain-containing protein n=1 Tax=Camellia sinensis TaxID=4442 RepID=A0A7J7G3A6_CAMSI|nr:hypothetical protein HYC85_029985 [Camellia sinensis]